MAINFEKVDPNTTPDITLREGCIVMIKEYGATKWVVCFGWYTYEGARRNGWYFKSVTEGKILPEYEVDASSIKHLREQENNRPHHPDHWHDHEESEHRHHYHKQDIMESCFVTVNTIAERNALGDPYPPDGKIVRVNDVKDEVRYYVWNAEELSWLPWSLNDEISKQIEVIDNRVKTLEEWVYMDKPEVPEQPVTPIQPEQSGTDQTSL